MMSFEDYTASSQFTTNLSKVTDKSELEAAATATAGIESHSKEPPQSLTQVPMWPCICISLFSGCIYGYNTAIVAGLSNPLVQHSFYPHSSEAFVSTMTGLLVSCILMGAFLGTVLSMPFANYFGRRAAFIACGGICFTACSLLGFADSFVAVILLRTLLGVAVGMTVTICPLYNAECSPPHRRGIIGASFQLSIVSAILLAELVNYAFNPENKTALPTWAWRVQFVCGGVFGFGLVVAGVTVPESNVWRALQQRNRQLHQQRREAEQRYQFTHRSHFHDTNERDAYIARSTTDASPTARRRVADDNTLKGWRGLFDLSNLRWLILAFLLAASNQLTGINAMIYYAPKIFEDAGYHNLALVLTIAVIGSWNLISVLISIPLIKRVSRRRLMLASHVIMCIGLVLITTAFAIFSTERAIISVIALLLFIIGFEIGPGTLFWILSSEIFPDTILHAGCAFANQLAWAANISLTFVFPILLTAIGAAATFGFFLAVCILSFIGFYVLLPEVSEQHPHVIRAECELPEARPPVWQNDKATGDAHVEERMKELKANKMDDEVTGGTSAI